MSKTFLSPEFFFHRHSHIESSWSCHVIGGVRTLVYGKGFIRIDGRVGKYCAETDPQCCGQRAKNRNVSSLKSEYKISIQIQNCKQEELWPNNYNL